MLGVISQIRIDARNMGVNNVIWKWFEPPLRFPFICVESPQCRIAIRGTDAHGDVGIIWNKNFANILTVKAFDWR